MRPMAPELTHGRRHRGAGRGPSLAQSQPSTRRGYKFDGSFNLAIHCSAYLPILGERCAAAEMGNLIYWRVGGPSPSCAGMRQQHGRAMRPARRTSSDVHRPQPSRVEPKDASQSPKIMAPIVKTKTIVPIQMTMAAFFSELTGVGFMTGQPQREQ
jgi:hypothetical protein